MICKRNKQTNVTYLYWGHSTYVAGLNFPKVEKKCIGKINSKGEFEPNKTFLALSVEHQMETGLVDKPYLSPYTRGDVGAYEVKMFGFIALLETAAKEVGVWQSLKKVFPCDWQQQLAIVEAMMSYPDRALYRPKHFHDVCWHTLVDAPTEYSITKALKAADPEAKQLPVSRGHAPHLRLLPGCDQGSFRHNSRYGQLLLPSGEVRMVQDDRHRCPQEG